ncbi:hypothetical protein F4820DRAFT_452800 [Hypoxylon rubiginosum]|uniref:Uncharacterized protein n=1 Tax=Hypoxylon rubiginosum TaxID=110542 RepID=A0ACB9YMW0_9PEZI|nr:hypothetical protein F4820DRAFT_452800 [Hypoxylon rubiginosum]
MNSRRIPWYYLEWSIKPDGSLFRRDDQLAEGVAGVNGWQGVEIVSPVLLANRDGLNEVLHVIEFIRNNFWIDTPRSAGFHIHVGNGDDWFPTRSLRQIGSLLYGTDPILAQLHPPHRRENYMFAPSNRYLSNVSFGTKIDQLDQHPQVEDELQEQPSGPVRPWWNFWSRSDAATRQAQQEEILEERQRGNHPPRPRETAYKIALHHILCQSVLQRNSQRLGVLFDPQTYNPIPMGEAISVLLEAPNRDAVAQLLKVGSHRAAYNFDSHLFERFMKRTIEFRQPASTTDSATILCQISIALRLCSVCLTEDYGDLVKISADCSVAEYNPSYYDVYDLLLDLHLIPEARLVGAISNPAVNVDEAGQDYLRSIGLVQTSGIASLLFAR